MYFRELGDNRDLSDQRSFFGSVWKLFAMDEAIDSGTVVMHGGNQWLNVF